MSIGNATFVYRGQLDIEKSRIQFLLAAVCATFEQVDVILLWPGPGPAPEAWEHIPRQFPAVRSCTCIDARSRSVVRCRRTLRRLIADDAQQVIAVGFSVAGFLPSRTCLAWAVNGIPEERLLHGSTLPKRLAVRIAWAMAQRVHASVVIVVSEPMARLVIRRTRRATIVIPNSVDRSVFASGDATPRRWLTYQGGGSPWQGLDRLAKVWSAMHAADPSLHFRVISRDPRAHRLVRGFPDTVSEVRAAGDHDEVAALLQDARLGFLVRGPGIVNEVSWPMKLGEYLATGVPVAVSRVGWDAELLIERHDAGVIVDWSDPVEAIADCLLAYLGRIGSSSPPGVESAAAELDSKIWEARLREGLVGAAGQQRRGMDSPNGI